MEHGDRRRLLAKVARLYHHLGLRQIAQRLRISQARVSRLLQQAEADGIVQTVVVPFVGFHVEVEEQIEERYALGEVYVVDAVADDETDLAAELGVAAASIFAALSVEMLVRGVTSWSRTLRHMIDALQPMRTGTATVVELLGDLGSPQHQHDATRSTQRLAALTGAEQALGFFDRLDLALVGIGGCEADPLQAADGVFGEDQLRCVLEAGAIGQLCLRFLAADGTPVASPLDDLVTGVTLEQLRAALGGGRGAGQVRCDQGRPTRRVARHARDRCRDCQQIAGDPVVTLVFRSLAGCCPICRPWRRVGGGLAGAWVGPAVVSHVLRQLAPVVARPSSQGPLSLRRVCGPCDVHARSAKWPWLAAISPGRRA